NRDMVIEFHLDARSGVAPYLQIVQQVRQALRLGTLSVGDQLPTVKDVVAALAINPNTVLKAYRELEYEGLAAARPGVGTFVTGTIEVLGGLPAASPAQLARVGFVAQDAPTYAGLSVADHLRLGAHLNPGWDADLAHDRIERLGLDPRQRAGKLSGGQRAQLALTLAIAKRPELLILD